VSQHEAHDRTVEELAEDWANQGFKVQKEAVLPFVLADGRPHRADLLAEKNEQHYVIEVKLRGTREDRHWDDLARQIRARPGWHFKIYFVDWDLPPLPGAERIEAELANAEALLEQGKLAAATLLAASAFEASARRRLIAVGALKDDEVPTALVERLVSQGEAEQEDFVPLRDAIEMRDAIAHGHLDHLPGPDVVQRLVTDARRLLAAA
jgi:hypothetical protein